MKKGWLNKRKLIIFIVLVLITFLIYFYYPKKISLGAGIENIRFNKEKNIADISLRPFADAKNIAEINFILIDKNKNSYVYKKNQFNQKILIYAKDINGLKDFSKIREIFLSFTYKKSSEDIIGTYSTGPNSDSYPINPNLIFIEDNNKSLTNSKNSKICNPITCNEVGYECGVWGDNCDGILSCGKCSKKEYCSHGLCMPIKEDYTKFITENNITWIFNKKYQYGQFVNGDYWVVGPIIITNITPNFEYQEKKGKHFCVPENLSNCTEYSYDLISCENKHCKYENAYNGFEINLKNFNSQSFDARLSNFNISKNLNLPLTIVPNSSVIKIFSGNLVNQISILTVLDKAPLQAGKNFFRPSYFGDNKKFYSYQDLKINLLHSIKSPIDFKIPKLKEIQGNFQKSKLTIFYNLFSDESVLDKNSLNILNSTTQALIWLNFNESIEEKMPLLIDFVQEGIDSSAILKYKIKTNNFRSSFITKKLLLGFTSVMLNKTELSEFLENINYYQEFTKKTSEDKYWKNLIFQCKNNKNPEILSDPYGYIDTLICSEKFYNDSLLFQVLKSQTLILYLMPEIKIHWKKDYFSYVDRLMYEGIKTQPDPCAPITGLCNNNTSCNSANFNDFCSGEICNFSKKFKEDYKIKYGPAENHQCIKNTNSSGRFSQYSGNKFSNFLIDSLWGLYRYSRCNNHIKDIDEEGVDCGGSCVRDLDLDGFYTGMCNTSNKFYDCNDGNSKINPNAEEICDGVDNNCDNKFNDNYYLDSDNDTINDCIDNCVFDCNPNQEDYNKNNIGDICDKDFIKNSTLDVGMKGVCPKWYFRKNIWQRILYWINIKFSKTSYNPEQ